jgi:hypothetical protein
MGLHAHNVLLTGKKLNTDRIDFYRAEYVINAVRMLGPRLTSRGDIDSRYEERGKSTPSRLPRRDEQGKGRKPVDTLDRDSLTIPETHDFSDIFEMENYLQSVRYLAMDRGK